MIHSTVCIRLQNDYGQLAHDDGSLAQKVTREFLGSVHTLDILGVRTIQCALTTHPSVRPSVCVKTSYENCFEFVMVCISVVSIVIRPKCYLYPRRIVYERAPFQRTLATYAVSAIWHGFFPGYYLCAVASALTTLAARKVGTPVQTSFLNNMREWIA